MSLLFVFVSVEAVALTADEIVEQTDRVRNPQESFVMEVLVDSSGSKDTNQFEVYTKGKDKTLIRTLAPRRDKGRNLLMLDTDMWLYIPKLKRSIRVALNQKLSGEAANGDISRMNWSGDYKAKILKVNKTSWLLDLQESKKGLTYARVQVEVEKKTFRPLEAQYMTKNGKTLKVAKFSEYKNLAGALRPSKIVIQDAVRKDKVSTISIVSMKIENLADNKFHRNNLK